MKPALFALCILALGAPLRAAEPTAQDLEFFEKKIRPVLAEQCFSCHSAQAKRLKGKLRLDTHANLLKGGESGVAIVPGKPEKSRLIEALEYQNVELQMPPKAKLPDAVIADFKTWIKNGAAWPRETVKADGDKYDFDLARRKQEHWAWKPIRPTAPPQVKDPKASPIDRFLLARLEDKGLAFAPQTDPRTLIRRLSFDLIGLPPTSEETDAFLKECGDTIPQAALEKLVDRLLASPHFGERWGRHWLDLVRYAESRGHEFDYNLPNAYQYRDYVIRALNEDVPYDQFVVEHVAGDLLAKPRLHPKEQFDESILGTGFWFLGEQVHSPVDICQDKADRQDNMIDVMTKTFLGLTVACARCHDHKFDAISTKDYYALAGFLESSTYRLAGFDSLRHNRTLAEAYWKSRAGDRPALQRSIADAMKPGLQRVAAYLQGAHEVTTGKSADEVARDRKLDARTLARWTKQLALAAKDPSDPLHAFVRIAADKARAADVAKALTAEWDQRLTAVAEATKKLDIVVDYARARPEDWMQDGSLFGLAPTRVGDLHWTGDATRPIARIHDRGAAVADALTDRLKLAPGGENEPGSLGKMVRAGRTLRTPTFRVTTGLVYYLVRGSGMAYAGVDGHVMIAGPLHGQLVLDIRTGPGYQWVAQNLTRYKGNRAHIEFTPAPGADFAVAMIVQAENPPPSLDLPPAVSRVLVSLESIEALANSYEKLFENAMGALADDKLTHVPGAAQLADWMLRNQDLFASPEAEDAGKTPFFTAAVREAHTRLLQRAQEMKTEARIAPAMLDGNGVDENVFIRGTYKKPGDLVPRRFLEALVGSSPLQVERGSGRLELARQITDPAVTPFVPRVMVNRIWHHLFGRGIVGSVDNFGVLGEAPSHPELLDYLADQFVKDGWSTKKLIRALVLTRAYRMMSQPDERARQVDPRNLLLHHMQVRRLEGEAIRDALLQVSGRLDRKMFGPPVPVFLNAFQDGRGRPGSGPLDGDGRRSVYLSVRRNFLPALLLAFDTPIPFSTVGRRTVSNVPAQALILLNDPFVHQQAGVWAKRVLADKATREERITRMYQTAFNRPPGDAELAACVEFLDRQARLSTPPPTEQALWTDLAHVLFNAKEFIFVN